MWSDLMIQCRLDICGFVIVVSLLLKIEKLDHPLMPTNKDNFTPSADNNKSGSSFLIGTR